MSLDLTRPIIYNHAQHSHLLPEFARIHIACIENDYTLATFLPPFKSDRNGTDSRVLDWWEDKAVQATAGSRFIIMQMMRSREHDNDVLAGYVMLDMPPGETGPFRGSVQKLLVDSKFRRMGIAKSLMGRLEEVAIEKGRTMLLLDTEAGSPADLVYPRLGWHRRDVIPNYGISPKDGRLIDEAFYYKDLKKHGTAA